MPKLEMPSDIQIQRLDLAACGVSKLSEFRIISQRGSELLEIACAPCQLVNGAGVFRISGKQTRAVPKVRVSNHAGRWSFVNWASKLAREAKPNT
jgi:hypothetical protein